MSMKNNPTMNKTLQLTSYGLMTALAFVSNYIRFRLLGYSQQFDLCPLRNDPRALGGIPDGGLRSLPV